MPPSIRRAIAILCLAGPLMPSANAASPSNPWLHWQKSVAGLGYRQGLPLGANRDVWQIYFAVPSAATSLDGTLTLTFAALLPVGTHGHVVVSVGEEPLAGLSLSPGSTKSLLAIPIASRLIRDGMLPVEIRLTGGSETETCARETLPLVTVQPESHLAFDIPAGRVLNASDRLALLPDRTTLLLPPPPFTATEYEAALRIAAALARGGRTVQPAYNPPQDETAASVVLKRSRDGRLPLLVETEEIDHITVSLEKAIEAMEEGALENLFGPRRTREFVSDTRLTLTEMGAESGLRHAGQRAHWTIPLSLAQLPPGLMPASLSLSFVLPDDLPGTAHLLHIFLDESLVTSRRLPSGGGTHKLGVTLPRNTLGIDSTVRVVFERLAADCKIYLRALPVELSAESFVRFAPVEDPLSFAALVPLFARGVDMTLPTEFLDRPAETMPLAIALTRDFVRAPFRAALGFSPGHIAPTGPFIHVNATPPPAAVPLISFDRGPVTIVDQARAQVLDLGEGQEATLAQVVEAAGQRGLWVKPAMAMLPDGAHRTTLARGNVALIDNHGTALWFDAHASRGLAIHYAKDGRVAELLARYWPWVIGVLWLVLTFLLLGRRRRIREVDGR